MRLARHFTGILETALTNPASEIVALEMVTPEEKEQILYEFNEPGTTDIDNKTIHGLFEEQVEKTPDSIAVLGIGTEKPVGKESLLDTLSTMSTQSTSSIPSTQEIPLHESTYGALLPTAYHHPPTTSLIQITYRELNKKANQLAQLLQTKGVAAGTIVAIKTERTVEMLIGLLGILKANAAYLPIDPNYPKERIDYMLKDSNTGILLTELKEFKELDELQELHELKDLKESNEVNKLNELEIETIAINTIYDATTDSQQPATRTIGRGEPCVCPSTQPRTSDLVYVIYTSG
ncbi:MAG: AMP-binding protein, partial [bacterium]|nr:AMP-binding protein [bacterium]